MDTPAETIYNPGMIEASDIKAGAVLRFDKDLFKVLEAGVHSGAGRAGATMNLKLRNLATGHVSEKKLAPDEKVEDLDVTRAKMQLLFKETNSFTFMNAETFDQLAVAKQVVGAAAAFLKENDECEMEFFEEKPLAVLYPKAVELAVSSTGAGSKGHGDSTMKEATLENGMTIHVPHFIKEGDHVRVEVETGKYLDRVTDREVKGAKFTTAAPPQKKEAPKPADAPAADAKPAEKPKAEPKK